jgi:hypothetical protein
MLIVSKQIDISRNCDDKWWHLKQISRPLQRNNKYHLRTGHMYSKMILNYNNISPVLLILVAAQIYIAKFDSFTVLADKDSNWYLYGENPNNKFRMYWKDAPNVLQDLSKFRSLHVKYHGCV